MRCFSCVVARRVVTIRWSSVEQLERALEVALRASPAPPRRGAPASAASRRRSAIAFGLGEPLPRRPPCAATAARMLARRDARAHAHRASPGLVDALDHARRRAPRRRAPSGRGARPTRGSRASPPSSVGRAQRGVGERDRARVVARGRLELARLEPPLAALARSTPPRARGRPPRRGAPRCAPRAPTPVARATSRAPARRRRASRARPRGSARRRRSPGRWATLKPQLGRAPVCTTNSRSFSVGDRALERRHRLAEHAREHRRRRWGRRGRPPPAGSRDRRGARRATREATRPRSVFGQRQVLPHELHRRRPAVGDRDRADVDEALDDLLDEQRVAAGARAHEAHELVGRRLDARGAARRAARRPPAPGRPARARRGRRRFSSGCEKPARAAKTKTSARVRQALQHLLEEREAVLVHRVRRRPTRTCAGGPRRGSAPCARRPAAGSAFAFPEDDGTFAPSAVSTALTSSACRPSARRRGCDGQDARPASRPRLVPQSTCSMQTMPESGNSLPRGGQVATWKPTL